jgi:hypothetical protein
MASCSARALCGITNYTHLHILALIRRNSDRHTHCDTHIKGFLEGKAATTGQEAVTQWVVIE